LEATCFTEIFIEIKMNTNQANESDGSFHIRVNPLPKKTKPKVETKEVKIDKKQNRK
tara:strand:+ start:30 stop:200 length:171 start_codon:yes stop_codon:yes gene_type:complete